MAKDLAVVLNNGGLNSVVTTALCAQRFRPVMLYVELSPGTPSRHRAAYDLQVSHFRPYREHTIPMPYLNGLAPGMRQPAPHTRGSAILAEKLSDLTPMLAMAARLAASYQAMAIYIGVRVGENADEQAQAAEYFQIWEEMLQIPCQQPELAVITPLLELESAQVVELGLQVGAPMERSWSCLEQSGEPCGACPGCRARATAFMQAARSDPLAPAAR